MSMKDKALLIKEDFDQLFDAGKQSVISNSKYIEKSASGKVIRLDDVSGVAHKVKVKADTPTEVKVRGKNLFNNDTSLLKKVSPISSSGTQFTRIGYEPYILPAGTYTFTLNDSGTVTDKYIYGVINDKDGKFVRGCNLMANTVNNTPLTIAVNNGDKVYIYDGNSNLSMTYSANRFNSVEIQLEVGVGTNEYEPYKSQTITATPSGTEISSMCPDMTFLADNDITVDYFGSYGMQTEYDRFWDNYQDYGKRTNYSYAFCHTGWTNANFLPKYDITITGASQMFYYSKITDLDGILKRQGIVIDSSKATSVTYMYGYSSLTRIPTTDLSSATNTTYLCAGDTGLVSIEKIVSSEKTVFANNSFNNCTALEHVIFEGTIASDINLQWSPKLDLESLISLFSCLKFFASDDTNYMTKTITLSAESWALTETQEFMDEFEGQYGKMLAYFLGWNHA